MHVRVLDLLDLVRITVMREPSEARSVEIDSQRLIAGDKYVDSHVKLLSSDQKWVHDVSLHDVRLSLWTLWLPPEVILPLRDLSQLVKEEDASSLGLADGFHDPNTTDLSELFNEQGVITR